MGCETESIEMLHAIHVATDVTVLEDIPYGLMTGARVRLAP
jgi:hypothetical protein